MLLVAGLAVIVARGARARPVVQQSLDEAFGPRWRDELEPSLANGLRTRAPLGRVLLTFAFRPRSVERRRNIPYGPAGRAHLLDLYRHRSHPANAPVLLYFHGGGYSGGFKSFESRALLFRLASRGWVTVSANYRLRPHADFYDHLSDLKRVIAWVRRHADEIGADPATVVVAGSSAGGHMATMAALTPNAPRYQPGFEDADTSVTAAVSIYGWHGGYYELGDAGSEAGPLGHTAEGAPPVFVAHGENDTIAYVETARRTVAHLRAGSSSPVVYAELAHGQHAFDLFHSLRYSAVVDGIEAFTAVVRSRT
nr:alpha/beta hydrolase [Microbacterium invictum]